MDQSPNHRSEGTIAVHGHAIVMRLAGGLGNQLFQWAAGRGIAQQTGRPLLFDVSSGFRNDPYLRRLQLSNFDIDVPTVSVDVIRALGWSARLAAANSPFAKLLSRLGWHGTHVYRERTPFRFDERVWTRRPPTYYIGYWQNPAYFASIADDIRGALVLKSDALNDYARSLATEIESTKALGIHIRSYARDDARKKLRRGTAHFTLCNDYYEHAVRVVLGRCGFETVYLFGENYDTEEYPFLKQLKNVKRIDSRLIGNDAAEQWVMSRCFSLITANSTYSWWAAWMNHWSNGVVVAPRRWFTSGRSVHDLIPVKWMMV